MKIVVNKNTPFVVEAFSTLGEVVAVETLGVTPDVVRDADALIVRSETRVNRALLDGSRVKFVGTVTIGTDHVDLEYLKSRDIAFVSAPGSNSNSVAEYITAALLEWSAKTGLRLAGRSIGIVGVGNVGSKIVRVAQTLGLQPVLSDPPLARATGDPRYRPLDELMDADFITLHVPLTSSGEDRTRHFFDTARIGKMKRGSVLLNTSRGPVVETEAIKRALKEGRLHSAILDVWEGEPTIDRELADLVLLGTPHIAGYSLDGKVNALRMVYEAFCRFLGVPTMWSSAPVLSDAGMPPIMVPANAADQTEAAAAAVRQAYDIVFDDAALRASLRKPDEKRGAEFMRLRAEYRTRREFGSRVVTIPDETYAPVLKALGFRTATAGRQR